MKKDMKKSRPAADTAERLVSRTFENNRNHSIPQFARFGNTRIPVTGIYRDAEGRWSAMPVLDMPEETPEHWNAKAAALRRKREEGAT